MIPRGQEAVRLNVRDGVATLTLSRAEKANALDAALWAGLRTAFESLARMSDVRAVILRGDGKHFCAGIDLELLRQWIVRGDDSPCPAAFRDELRQWILELQRTVTVIERCGKPVIAAIHGTCFGAGVDLVATCDLRYCTSDARFSVKEVDFGIVADLGSLQRLPAIVGDGIARELALTARVFDGSEAERIGFVSACLETRAALEAHVEAIAQTLAKKPTLAMRGCKEALNFARDHSVEDGLLLVAERNAAILLSQELRELVGASRA